MTGKYDVIVVGLGAMGSAAASQLSGRGFNVLGLDSHSPPHEMGSTHAYTRMIREAYFEHPSYVPLVQRAYDCWDALAKSAGKNLLQTTGAIMIGPEDGAVVQGSQLSGDTHNLPYEKLSAHGIQSRFPALHIEPEMVGIYEPHAGLLLVDDCLEFQLSQAQSNGATLNMKEAVTAWSANSNGVEITTINDTYCAEKAVFSAGSWMSDLLPDVRMPLEVERQVLYFFEPKANADMFGPEKLAPFMIEYGPGQYFYAFCDIGHGLKLGLHHQGEITTADTVNREVSDVEETEMRELISRFMPDANGRLLEAKVCLYTNTPDDHFILDQHPDHANVTIVSPCSGHGFKFSPVIGEIVAQRLMGETPQFDLDLFKLDRFQTA
jgi:sarcosine oxidase